MAFTGTLCTEAEIVFMAGENVDATGSVEANHNILVAQAESYLVSLSKYNWIDNIGSLNADIKGILAEYCSRYAASALIAYNMEGYTSRIEAEDMINIHFARMRSIEKLLKEQNYVTFITGA